MQVRRYLVAAVAVAGMSVVLGVPQAATASAAACPDTMIFELGGHLDPDAGIFDRSNATLPAGVGFRQIHYPAQIAPFPGDTISLDDSNAEGLANLDRAVRDFHGECGGSHITITGYSQGALVAGDELEALSKDSAIPHEQINGVLYADGRRLASNGGPGGIEGNLPTIIPGLTMRGTRGFGDIAVEQLCNQNDGICNSENPVTNLLGFANGVAGYLTVAHGQYDFNPLAHNGNSNTVTPQPNIIPYGPPLPFPVGTPWEWFNGDRNAATNAVTGYRNSLSGVLPGELRDRLAEFPYLSVP